MQLDTFVLVGLTVAALGLAVAVLCLPILLSTRAKTLFRSLPPVGSMIPSYVGTMMALLVPFVAVVVAVFGLDIWQRPRYDVLTQGASIVSYVYVVALPIAATFGLQRYGTGWNPTGYGVKTWAVMLLSTLWYVIWCNIPIMLIAGLLALPTG